MIDPETILNILVSLSQPWLLRGQLLGIVLLFFGKRQFSKQAASCNSEGWFYTSSPCTYRMVLTAHPSIGKFLSKHLYRYCCAVQYSGVQYNTVQYHKDFKQDLLTGPFLRIRYAGTVGTVLWTCSSIWIWYRYLKGSPQSVGSHFFLSLAFGTIQCCRSGSMIRDPMLFWPLDSGWKDPDPGSEINIPDHISVSSLSIVWVKNT